MCAALWTASLLAACLTCNPPPAPWPRTQPWSQQEFDPAPYSEQLRTNQSHQVESTQRNFVGSGNIMSFGP